MTKLPVAIALVVAATAGLLLYPVALGQKPRASSPPSQQPLPGLLLEGYDAGSETRFAEYWAIQRCTDLAELEAILRSADRLIPVPHPRVSRKYPISRYARQRLAAFDREALPVLIRLLESGSPHAERNALEVLAGNRLEQKAFTPADAPWFRQKLLPFLSRPEWEVRMAAVKALTKLPDADLRPALVSALQLVAQESETLERSLEIMNLLEALKACGSPEEEIVPWFLRFLNEPESSFQYDRQNLIRLSASFRNSGQYGELLRAKNWEIFYSTEDWGTVLAILETVDLTSPETLSQLRKAFTIKQPNLRKSAVRALFERHSVDLDQEPELLKSLRADESEEVRAWGVHAMISVAQLQIAPVSQKRSILAKALSFYEDDPSDQVRCAIVVSVGAVLASSAPDVRRELLRDVALGLPRLFSDALKNPSTASAAAEQIANIAKVRPIERPNPFPKERAALLWKEIVAAAEADVEQN